MTEETNATNEVEDPNIKARAGLPLQLHRLPLGRLRTVSAALEMLRKMGLEEIMSIEMKREKIAGYIQKVESFQTAYAAMNEWAWTRKRWQEARKSYGSEPKCELEAASVEEVAAKINEASEALATKRKAIEESNTGDFPKLRETLNRFYTTAVDMETSHPTKKLDRLIRILGRRADGKEESLKQQGRACFKRFVESQLAAEAELRAFADVDWSPKSHGVGSRALFQMVPAAELPKSEMWGPRRRTAQLPPLSTRKNHAIYSSASVVSVHVGAAGCGMGLSMWQRLMVEHGIGPDMTLGSAAIGSTAVHFQESLKSKFLPRAVLVDVDPSGYSSARAAACFAPENFVEFSGNYTAGTFNEAIEVGGAVIQQAQENLRKQWEATDYLSAVLLTHSVVGGVGSGVGSKLLDFVAQESPKKSKWSLCLTPHIGESGGGPSVWYNFASAVPSLVSSCDSTVFVDNFALHKVASSQSAGLGISEPGHVDYNSLVARVLAAWTSPLRIGPFLPMSSGSALLMPRAATTSLTPYPRIHFCMPSVGPLLSEAMRDYATPSLKDGAQQALAASSLLSTVDLRCHKYMAVALYGRGVAESTKRGDLISMLNAVNKFKTKSTNVFCDWSPVGFQLGFHQDPSLTNGSETVCLFNSTAVSEHFKELGSKVDALLADSQGDPGSGYSKDDIQVAREEIAGLVRDYAVQAQDPVADE